MKISVIGTGYVGLVAGVCWAYVGNKVTCVDIDEKKVAMMQAGKSPIFEPGLEERLTSALKENNISFSTNLAAAARDADVSVIAVGTPSDEDGSFNSKYVVGAAKEISAALQGTTAQKYVVIRSTINTDIFAEVKNVFAQQPNVDVISSPEFLAQGTAVQDFEKPNRVVIGTNSEHARHVMSELYEDFVKKDGKIFFVKPESAIWIKLGANNHLFARVNINNELAELCDKTGADYDEVRRGIGADTRVGSAFLYAGPGAGGSCFGKDNRDLAALSKRKGLDLKVLPQLDPSNKRHKQYLAESVIKTFYDNAGGLTGKTLGVWGLAFKANTDDMRESASLDIIRHLVAHNALIRAHDPEAMERAKAEFAALGINDKITYCPDKYDAVKGADGLVILTEWPIYKKPDFPELQARMRSPVIFDGRGILNRESVVEHGLVHYSIGRGFAYPKSGPQL